MCLFEPGRQLWIRPPLRPRHGTRRRRATLAVVLAMAAQASAQITVSSSDELTNALNNPQPGDEIVVSNGSYRDWLFGVSRSGTSSAPILIRAETPGKVILSGSSRIGGRKRDGSDIDKIGNLR